MRSTVGSLALQIPAGFSLQQPVHTIRGKISKYRFPKLYSFEAASGWLNPSTQGHGASDKSSIFHSLFSQVPATPPSPHLLSQGVTTPLFLSQDTALSLVVSLNLTSPL